MRRLVVLAFLFAVLALAGTSRFAAADDTLKVAIPQKGAWDAGLVELGQRAGIFKKHGLTLDILYTAAGPESIQAMIAGSIDIAVASGVSAAIGTFSKGAPIRIISSEMTGAPDLYWYVPADSPIHAVADFNGKTVAFSAVGSSSHGSLLALIAQDHLTAKPQQTGNIAATITQTMTGQVDVGFGAAPFGLPDSIVQRVLKLVPKESLQTDQVKGLDDIMADAVTQKFLAAPLTPDQVKELVQIPK